MLLIKNGRVLTMEGTTLPQGCVLIKGGKIKRVAPTIDETNLPRHHILDAQGGWIMPGLIESHCHIGITEANKGTGLKMSAAFKPYFRYILPLLILVILAHGLISTFFPQLLA